MKVLTKLYMYVYTIILYKLVYLGSLNDDCVSRKVDSPSQCGSGHKNLDMLISKQFFNESSVHPVHAGMVNSKAIGEKILQLNVLLKRGKMREINRNLQNNTY